MKNNNSVVNDFKKFINKGNIFELATGIIIGAAFTSVVNSLVYDIIMPLISNLINFDLSSARVVLREEVLDEAGEVVLSGIYLNYGSFLQYCVNFFIIALFIFIVIKVIKRIKNGYIKSEIKFIKRLKEKHPEYFDDKEEYGSILYEKLKAEHPEHFQEEINAEIEEKKASIESNKTPQEITNELLLRLNENLERLEKKEQEEEK